MRRETRILTIGISYTGFVILGMPSGLLGVAWPSVRETFGVSLDAVGALLIQLCLGAIYAWSVFTPHLKDSGWSKLDTQVVFSVGLAMFAIVMVFAGRKLKDWGPQRLALAGGLTLGVGYLIASPAGGTNFWLVLLGVGLVGGAGIGLAYVVPIAVGMLIFALTPLLKRWMHGVT